MIEKNVQGGAMIVLAYPQAFCTMVPAWYNPILTRMGILHDDKICAGHAAILLIDPADGHITYTDFGRYITPLGMGRARLSQTDPEIGFEVKAQFHSDGTISNVYEILQYTSAHPEKTHGSGVLYASVHQKIDLKMAMKMARSFNKRGSMPYAPFKWGASNCSRYIASIIRVALTKTNEKIRFNMGSLPTASPLSNVLYSSPGSTIFRLEEKIIEELGALSWKQTLSYFFSSFPKGDFPDKSSFRPDKHFQWLSGLGDGAWFGLSMHQPEQQLYRIQRYNMQGHRSFDHVFQAQDPRFQLKRPYRFVYDCNALECNLIQDGNKITFNSV